MEKIRQSRHALALTHVFRMPEHDIVCICEIFVCTHGISFVAHKTRKRIVCVFPVDRVFGKLQKSQSILLRLVKILLTHFIKRRTGCEQGKVFGITLIIGIIARKIPFGIKYRRLYIRIQL